MTETIETDVLVVGGGPGGYVAAIRAGQLGLSTTLVEAGKLGGTCLLRGCIPSKAIIHAAGEYEAACKAANGGHLGIRFKTAPELDFRETVAWKDGIVKRLTGGVGGLLKRAKVRVVEGWATFQDAKTCRVEGKLGAALVKAKHVILANGSVPVELPFLPFGGPILSSTEALDLEAPPKRLAVVGAGYIGLELGIAFAKLGSAVTVVEALDRILPLYDAALTAPVAKNLKKLGVSLHLGVKAKGYANGALAIETTEGETQQILADKVLVTVGRRPATQGWGLERMGLEMAGPFVRVDAQCRTAMAGVYAIGDLVGEPMLAHKASAQGEMVAEIIAGKRRSFAPAAIPAVCFTDPEIVSVGLSPEEAKAQGKEIKTAIFPLSANGRAMSLEADGDDGFVRVVALASDHRLLGVQAVGKEVSELSGEFVLALEMGARLEDIAHTIHAHPTLSETFHEASLRTLGHALHI
jgi:dihydrolipoamide dehydrogenase